MKIVFVGPAVSIHIQKWVDAFKAENEVHLVTMHPVQDASWHFENTHVLQVRNAFGYYLNAGELHSIVAKLQPDVVNVHYASGYGTLARRARIGKYILNVWGSDVFDFPYESKLKMRIIQKNLRAAEQIASTSEVMKRQTEKLIAPKKEIVVTPFGVDTTVFAPKEKAPQDKIVIGTVKTLSPKYGIDVLIKAYNEAFVNGLTNSELLIVGGGPQEAELKALAKSLPSAGNIQFLGFVKHDEVPKYLTQFDVYVALSESESESFGVAVVEAESCGVPVIVSNVGGLPEVVLDGETGFVVPHGDYAAAAEKMLLLSNNSDLRKKMGESAREFVCKKYAWNVCVGIMENMFNASIAEVPAKTIGKRKI